MGDIEVGLYLQLPFFFRPILQFVKFASCGTVLSCRTHVTVPMAAETTDS